MALREYQARAVNSVLRALPTHPRVCLVSPTGSGKTVMLAEVAKRGKAAGHYLHAIAHREELVKQLASRVGVNSSTVQGRLQGSTDPFDKLVTTLLWDECHHASAPEWKNVIGQFPNVKYIIGATATPENGGGNPLGGSFDTMVVAAQYPELVRAGYISPVRIVRPNEYTAPDIGFDPVKAYLERTPGERAFLFARDIESSKQLAQRFSDAGVPAAHVDGSSPEDVRRLAIQMFRDWGVQVLCNCFLFTEGLDVPEASTCILARGVSSPGAYLQMVGRVLRPHPSKKWATILDCVGASWIHGSPIARRVYSLEKGIELAKPFDVRDCPQCGWCGPTKVVCCPQCQWDFKENAGRKRKPKLCSKELHEVYAGIDTPPKAKAKEWTWLSSLAESKNYSQSWAVRKYRDLFDELPAIASDEEFQELCLLEDALQSQDRGMKPGRAMYLFEETFGFKDWKLWNRVKKKL